MSVAGGEPETAAFAAAVRVRCHMLKSIIVYGLQMVFPILFVVAYPFYRWWPRPRWVWRTILAVGMTAAISRTLVFLLHSGLFRIDVSAVFWLNRAQLIAGGMVAGMVVVLLISGEFLRLFLWRTWAVPRSHSSQGPDSPGGRSSP